MKQGAIPKDLNDWASEVLLGRRRAPCVYYESIWRSQCQECSQKHQLDGKDPCPFYLFPQVTLWEIAEAWGWRGRSMHLEFGPTCGKNKWTVRIGSGEHLHTDKPLVTLLEIMHIRLVGENAGRFYDERKKERKEQETNDGPH